MVALKDGATISIYGIELFNYIIFFVIVKCNDLSWRQNNIIESDIINSAFKVAAPINIERTGIIW